MSINIDGQNRVRIYYNPMKREFEFTFEGSSLRLVRIPYRFISNFEKLAFKHLDDLIH